MKTLPANVRATKRTPEFTEASIPAGLLRDHATKPGVWGVIHVLDGELEYHILEPIQEYHTLRPGMQGIVEPAMKHQVAAPGTVRFYVEFHAEPASNQAPASA